MALSPTTAKIFSSALNSCSFLDRPQELKRKKSDNKQIGKGLSHVGFIKTG